MKMIDPPGSQPRPDAPPRTLDLSLDEHVERLDEIIAWMTASGLARANDVEVVPLVRGDAVTVQGFRVASIPSIPDGGTDLEVRLKCIEIMREACHRQADMGSVDVEIALDPTAVWWVLVLDGVRFGGKDDRFQLPDGILDLLVLDRMESRSFEAAEETADVLLRRAAERDRVREAGEALLGAQEEKDRRRTEIVERGFLDMMEKHGSELFERIIGLKLDDDEGRHRLLAIEEAAKEEGLVAMAIRNADEVSAFADRTMKILELENELLAKSIERMKRKRDDGGAG